MDEAAQRAALQALIDREGAGYAELSEMLGRNPAYIQQYMKRGSPRLLPERDRRRLADYLGAPESALGGGEDARMPAVVAIARYDIGASAGPGSLVDDDGVPVETLLPLTELRRLKAGDPRTLHLIRVAGDSMLPTLADGDEILVDTAAPTRPRAGLWVIAIDGAVMVKRLAKAGAGWHVASDSPEHDDPGAYDPARMELKGRVLRAVRRFV